MPTSSAETLEGRAGASGEVGLLGEEAAQRLLSIFVEAAMSCLGQIRSMSMQHGDGKFNALFQVGLDLVQRWEADVVQEEVIRVVTIYPEVPALHSYAFLWLLDRLCGDCDIKTLEVPPLSDVYAGFMKRVAAHRDVRQGRSFLAGPELHRRTVFVEAFRGCYHDVLQRRKSQRGASRPHISPLGRAELSISPDEAASQVGVAGATARVLEATGSARSGASSATVESRPAPSALQRAMQASERVPCGHYVAAEAPTGGRAPPDATFSLLAGAPAIPCLSDVAPPSPSDRTKAVTVAGPCFFSHDAPASAVRYAPSAAEEPQSGPPTRV